MESPMKRLYSIPEAREYLGGIGHSMMYELIARNEVHKVNIGRRGFVTTESLEAYVDRLKASAKAS